jgi:hypothetical protein
MLTSKEHQLFSVPVKKMLAVILEEGPDIEFSNDIFSQGFCA